MGRSRSPRRSLLLSSISVSQCHNAMEEEADIGPLGTDFAQNGPPLIRSPISPCWLPSAGNGKHSDKGSDYQGEGADSTAKNYPLKKSIKFFFEV